VTFSRIAWLTIAAASTACLVPKKDYDQCVATASAARAAADARQSDDAARLAQLQSSVTAAESASQDRDAHLSELSTTNHNLQAQLDEATAMNQQLRGELERLGKDVDKVLTERGTLSKALDEAKARLEELRKAQAAAESRTMVFRGFQRRYKSLIDAGQLRVESRRGRLVMNVTGDLLFDPGRGELRSAGKGVVMEIARGLETSGSAKRFLVTAHADDEPLKSKHFKSVWELTAARAVTVVEYLVSLGVSPASLTAAGAGSSDPLVPNDSAAARAQNRRIEIALQPTAEETLPVEAIR